jgi:hypothetical protein
MIELITVLAILGVMAAVVAAALPEPEPDPPAESLAAARVRLAEARREAITRGRPVTVTVRIAPQDTGARSPIAEWRATALPDGSIIADAALAVERLTGRPRSGEPRR